MSFRPAWGQEPGLGEEQLHTLERILIQLETLDSLQQTTDEIRARKTSILAEACQVTSESVGTTEQVRALIAKGAAAGTRSYFDFIDVLWVFVGLTITAAVLGLAGVYLRPILERLPREVLEALGGGRSRVMDSRLQRHLVLIVANAGEERRLARHARILAQLDHPAIQRVHDALRWGNKPGFTTDEVEGEEFGPAAGLGEPALLRAFLDVAAAIAAVTNQDAEVMDLDDDGGEIAVVTSGKIKVFSMTQRRELTADEIERRWIPVNGNPYICLLYTSDAADE